MSEALLFSGDVHKFERGTEAPRPGRLLSLQPSRVRGNPLAVALPESAAAASQSITANGVARSYSANYFMRTACPRYFKVDQPEAAKVGEAALMFGNDRFGADVMKPLVVTELERRRLEVEATGESAWCSYQRASMIGDGLNQLFR